MTGGLDGVAEASRVIAQGGVVVVPTETVYGLAGRPDEGGVGRISELKGRQQDKTVQLLIPDAAWLGRFATASEHARRLAETFWPGPLTLVVPASAQAPAALVSGEGGIGLRVPSHPVALHLLEAAGALAASSANRSGEPTPRDLDAIRQIFGDEVGVYLDGGVIEGRGSTVVDLTGERPQLLRAGDISQEQIDAVVRPWI